MKTVIMAGGQGTRIAEIASDIPKPMIPVAGKPVLEHQMRCLSRSGFTDILLVTGHLGEKIHGYFGNGEQFGVTIRYRDEKEPLGTAGALFPCLDILPEDFFLINGDIIFDMDLRRLAEFHLEKKALATLVSHPNSHPWDSALLVTDGENRIAGWLNREDQRDFYRNRVNAGIHVLSRALVAEAKNAAVKTKIDLDRDILKPALNTGRIFAYDTPEYIKDMGTPDRFYQVERDIARNIPALRNLSKKQKAVFLDRDGTINEFSGLVTRHEDLSLIPGAAEAIKKINEAGFLAVVVTNQPVIARGDVTPEELETIHRKLETELGKKGAWIDALYFCPHHPEKGFPGERPEYKIECECRKPKPGMILEAAKKFNIDLSQSWMAGDGKRDWLAGKAAGCKTVLLSRDGAVFPGTETEKPDCVSASLAEFAEKFIV